MQIGINMKTEMLSTRIDHDTKVAFTHICDDMGLSPSQALKLFARAVINHGGIPFEVKAKQPSSQTLQAMQELEQGKGHKAKDASQLFENLGIGKLDNA
jgi:DNA-damage-inducible protein J